MQAMWERAKERIWEGFLEKEACVLNPKIAVEQAASVRADALSAQD